MNDGSPHPPLTPEQEARRQRDEADVLAAQAIETPALTELHDRIERYHDERGWNGDRSRGVTAEAARAILAADKRSGSPDPALRAARARIEQADALYWGVVARWGDLPVRLAKKWCHKAPRGITWDQGDLAGAARIGLHRGLLRYQADGGAGPRTWAVRWAESYAQRDNGTHDDLSGPAAVRGGFRRPAVLRAARLDAPLPGGRDGKADTRLLDMVAAPAAADVGDALDLARARADLQERLADLSERQRIAFVRHEIEGRTLIQIGAEDLGCSRERVRHLVNEAARALGPDVEDALDLLRGREDSTAPPPRPKPKPRPPRPPRPATVARIEAAILAAVAAHPGLTGRWLKKMVRGGIDIFYATLNAMIAAGRLCRTSVHAPITLPSLQEPPCPVAAPNRPTVRLPAASPISGCPTPPPAPPPTTVPPAVPESASSARATSSAAGSGKVRAHRKRVRRSGMMDRISAALDADPTLTRAQLAARIGAQPHAVAGALTFMRREGTAPDAALVSMSLEDQVLPLILRSPGITISDMNRISGLAKNSIRATVSSLRRKGLLLPPQDRTGRCYPTTTQEVPAMPADTAAPIERTIPADAITDALDLDADASPDAIVQAISDLAEAAAAADKAARDLKSSQAEATRLSAQAATLIRERDALRADLGRAREQLERLNAARPARVGPEMTEADLDARYRALAEARRMEEAGEEFRQHARAWGQMTEEEIEVLVARRTQQAATLRRLALTGMP